MRRKQFFSVCLLVVMVVAGTSVGVAALAGGRTVSGTVKDAEGKAAANVAVKLARQRPISGPIKRDPNHPTGDAAIGAPVALPLQKAPGMQDVVATTTTDAGGHFTFSNVASGSYTLIAGDASAAGRGSVTVAEDKDPTAVEIKLMKATR
jgi:hypothetical protein